jgi:murein DD-endopeptidase MepM/ murein hydrolase activator NlpD
LKEGRVSSFYGPRGGGFHDGVDLGAPKGTPVYAARAGKVIYSGRGIRGYGNVVIVKHNEIYSTIYAHNAKNLVRHGAYVRQGEKIALVGATGRATGPHLHFEVRRNERPYDPFFVLPRGGDATSTRGLASNRR